MLTRLPAILFALVVVAAGAATLPSRAASAAPCHNGGSCSISGGHHYAGRGGGGNDGGGGGGNTGPGLGCPNQGPQIVCTPGNAPAAVPHIPTIDVVFDARDQIAVPAPHVHTAPAGRTFVRLETGLWVDQADYVTRSITVTVPDQSVTATATPQSVTWNMGEGSVTCTGPGTPGGTACAYTYERSSASRPGGKYRISATITWALGWTCTGNCDQAAGQLDPLTMTTTADLAVGEVQTEARPG